MRLIDADALRDEIAVLFERNPNLIDGWLAYAVEDTIDDAPTIAPVKHGRWIGIDDYPYETWECDQCGCIYEEMPSWTPNYCPNCGADMRGEEDE